MKFDDTDPDLSPDAELIPDRDPALLARYLAGECSGEEVRLVERWIAEQPERAVLLEEFREARRIASRQRRLSYDLDAEWAKLVAKTDLTHPVCRRVSYLKIARRIAVAAGILLAAGAGSYLVLGTPDRPSTQQPALRTVSTRAGQRADVYLSDGTHVILAAASRLRYASRVGRASRDVYLEGEALFHVTHHDRWPFLVHTPHAITEDLGTTFAVRAYPGDSVVTVAVTEGKAELRRQGAPGVVLEQGDLGRMTATGRPERRSGVALAPYTAWAEGRLVFADTPLREVLPQLARWYGLDVRLADPALGARRLTATFTAESTEEVLHDIAFSLNLWYERQGRTITFAPK